MRILQICHRIPYPPVDGGNIVMMNMALALADAGHEVHQFSLNTRKHYQDPEKIPAELKKKIHFYSTDIDTKITVNGAVKNIFSTGSYNVDRFYSPEAEMAIETILKKNNFDIVQLETLFATPYISCIRKYSNSKIILRAHNVEHIIWERLASVERNILKKKYLNFLAGRMKKYELGILSAIDALIPITKVDEQIFTGLGFRKPVLTLPMSLDIREYPFSESQETAMCLFHLGSMDWMPNVEAVTWFLKNVWPTLHTLYPDLKLYLAGRNFPEDIIHKKHEQVFCEGTVKNAVEYMKHKQLMIVPLHSGSGMRVKIIQGLAMGKTIISTSIGAEGIPIEDGKNILIANSPEQFVSYIKRCVQDPPWCKMIGIRGRKFVEENFSNESIANQIGIFYGSLIGEKVIS